eukprot:CAMPEP_0206138726 /NCGR_PEP_ID=MMETSP1473-20131121/3518_1 /ASSEMBLY_ACC=CAM_ASM_001109 /TAXON_ID=1461547 /ORGANISM="Stichococcus sp, Strain RCC1054" /LENGTH=365 /DNA_ID=CAMNT_0053532233 /DNA_START=30 /DNA_END=1124 /DNA_ORIENTATION=+
MAGTKFYAVAQGRKTGVYTSWNDCEAQVTGSSGAIYKSFKTEKEARAYLDEHGVCTPAKKRIKPTKQPNLDLPAPATKPDIDPDLMYRMEFDGACRGNPGLAGAGAVLMEEESRKEVGRLVLPLQQQTNNVAEYAGLIIGLEGASQIGIRRINIVGDSKLIISQVNKSWKCEHERLKPLLERVRKLQPLFSEFHASHVLRHLNTVADQISNEALDTAGWEGLKMPEGDVVSIHYTLPDMLNLRSGGAAPAGANAARSGTPSSGRRRKRRLSPSPVACSDLTGPHALMRGRSSSLRLLDQQGRGSTLSGHSGVRTHLRRSETGFSTLAMAQPSLVQHHQQHQWRQPARLQTFSVHLRQSSSAGCLW